MEMMLAMIIKPFLVMGMLLVAYPVKRMVQKMKDGKLKRFLLISWN